MSFLFVDQVGSTKQLARLGDEGTRPLRQALHELLVREVEAHDGEVVDNTGDGVMAAFAGATAALRAGVGMHQAAARHNRRVPEDHEIHLRVGVNTGEVTADEHGRWFGMPVVIAARLCALAGTDEIWASRLTTTLAGAGEEFDVLDLGPHELKGVAAPVDTVLVPWSPADPGTALPPRLAQARRHPLSGRADDLARLDEAWSQAADGNRAIVLLAGEPGIGKTRLAAEAAHRAALSGALVVEGGCDAQLPVPFGPVIGAARQLLVALQDGEPAADTGSWALGRLLPELGGQPLGSGADPHAERLALFEEVDDLLTRAADDPGVVVVIDDLHWADEGTLQLLGHLARSERQGHLLVIGTYRESDLEPDHPLTEALALLWRTPVATRIGLDGLDAPAIQSLVAERTDGPEPSIAVARALATATAGNPFFIEELARDLVERDRVPTTGDQWAELDLTELALTDRVRDVVRERARRLGERSLTVLRLGAVMGRELSLTVLEAIDGGDDILDVVEEAARAALVEEVPDDPDRYRFRHALIRQALYEDVSAARRVRLHRAVAEALDGLPAVDPADLANHWGLGAGAAGHERAVATAEQAGRAAHAALAFERAREQFEAALGQLDRLDLQDDAWRARLLLGLGDALAALASDLEATQAAYEAAAEHARRADDRITLAWAALGRAGQPERMMQGETFPIPLLEEALSGVPDDEPALRARLLASLCAAFSSTTGGSADEQRALDRRSDELAEESIALARSADDPDALGFVLRARLRTWFDPLAVPERLAMAEELLTIGVERRDRSLEVSSLTWQAIALAESGRRDEFERCVVRAESLVTQIADPYRSWMVAFRRVTLQLLDGELEAAAAGAAGYLEAYQHSSFGPFAMVVWANQTLVARYLQGRITEVAWMADVLSGSSGAVARAFISAQSDLEAARAAIDEVVTAFDDVLAVRLGRTAALAVLAQAVHACRHEAAATVLRSAMAPYAETNVMMPPCTADLGHMSLYRALVTDVEGDLEAALALAERAVTENSRSRNRPFTAIARYHAGRLRLAGDAEGGAEVLGQARAEAEEMGMAAVVADVDALVG